MRHYETEKLYSDLDWIIKDRDHWKKVAEWILDEVLSEFGTPYACCGQMGKRTSCEGVSIIDCKKCWLQAAEKEVK